MNDDRADELVDMEIEILGELRTLIDCDWDSNTVKGKLIVKIGEWERLMEEEENGVEESK